MKIYIDKDDNNHIYIQRGDLFGLDIQIPFTNGEYRKFKPDDVIRFGIYNKRKLNEPALLLEEFKAEEESTTFRIMIEAEKMKLGELSNRPIDYWYEIILNNDITIVGYKIEDAIKKPAVITLLPEGSDTKESE